MKDLNYNHLFNFFVVARAGSIKSAALSLGVSQSTLSEQLKNLESDIGLKLFSRIGRSLSLSAEGRRLFEKVENFFSTDLGIGGQSQSFDSHSRVEIGITTTISRAFTYQILRGIFQKTGSLIRVTESTGDDLLMSFKKQEIDVFITHEKLSRSLVRKLKSISLKKPELMLVGTKKFEALIKTFPKGLDRQPFFLFTVRSQLRWEIEKFFRAQNIIPSIRAEVDDPELLKTAVLDELGIAVLPQHAVQQEIKDGRLLVLGRVPTSELDIYAHFIDGNANSDLQAVIKTLAQHT